MQLLDGKKVSMELFSRLKPRGQALQEKGIQPKLVFFLVGNNPASVAEVKMMQKACEDSSNVTLIIRYKVRVTEQEILERMEELNQDLSVHGMMIHLPLPPQLSVPLVTRAIDPIKDADGLHAYNFG